jgi:hypothetical protein
MSQYIVWNPASNLPPTVVHPNRDKAIKVAARMSHSNPGQTFFVCKLTNSVSKPVNPDLKYIDLEKQEPVKDGWVVPF